MANHQIYEQYNNAIACVYLTSYSGDKHPPYYVGSTYLDNHYNGYLGSQVSKKWAEIVNLEQKENPNLYSCITLHKISSRIIATQIEDEIIRSLDAVNSELFWNMGTADGCFGLSQRGEDNPMYGKTFITDGNIITTSDPENIPNGFEKTSINRGKTWYYDTCLDQYNFIYDTDINENHIKSSPDTGKITITNGKIFSKCLPGKIPAGWYKQGNTLGYVHVTNGIHNTYVPKDKIPTGYKKYHTTTGLVEISDGVTFKKVKPNEIPSGWEIKSSISNRIAIKYKNKCKKVTQKDLIYYLIDGWTLGMGPNKKSNTTLNIN